jgi:ubiquitin C-terminal hydrolase
MFNDPNLKKIITSSKVDSKKEPITFLLKTLFEQYDTEITYNDLAQFIRKCIEKIQYIDFTDQNDMHEFIISIIDILCEENKRVIKQDKIQELKTLKEVKSKQEKQNSHELFSINLQLSWFNCHCQSFSKFIPLYHGQLVSQIKCTNPKCQKIYHNIEIFTCLPIEVGDIRENITKFFKNETVENWKCDKCNKIHDSVVQTKKISKFPDTLIIVLKRFDVYETKNIDPVETLLELTFDQSTKLYSGTEKYNLQSIGCHEGTTEDGHYFAVVPKSKDKSTMFNDQNVVEMDNSYLTASACPYLYFYSLEK